MVINTIDQNSWDAVEKPFQVVLNTYVRKERKKIGDLNIYLKGLEKDQPIKHQEIDTN